MAFKVKASTPEQSLHDKMRPSKDLEVVRGLKVGVYGMPGVGKTYLGFSFPLPHFIVDIDGSSRKILEMYPEDIKDQVFIQEVKLSDEDGDANATDVVEDIADTIRMIKRDTTPEERKGTVIIDTASELLSYCNYWLEEQPNIKKYRQNGAIMRTEYAIRDRKYLQILAPLRDIEMNVLLIGHAKNKFDGQGNPTNETYPYMHTSVNQFVDVLGELVMDGDERKFIIRKDRFSQMKGKEIEEPTFTKIRDFFIKHAKINVLD